MAKFNRRLLVIVAPLLLLAIGACANMIPPIDQPNPFGLDGRPVPVTFESAGTASLAPQAVTGVAETSFTFNDIDKPPFPPTSIENQMNAASAVLASGTGPDTITITSLSIRLRGWQGHTNFDMAPANEKATINLQATGQLVLVKDGECSETECRYEVQEGASLGVLKMDGPALVNFMRIVTTDPTENYADLRVVVQAEEEDELSGKMLTLRLEAKSGTILFN